MTSFCSHGPRLAVGALAAASFLTALTLAPPATGQQCRGTKEWFEGACRYPDEVAKLKAERDKEAAAARQRAELERRKAEAARKKAEEERLKAEQAKAEQAKAEQAKAEQAKAEQAKAEQAKTAPTEPPGEPVLAAPTDTSPAPEPDQAESASISPLAYVGFAVAGVGVLVGSITGAVSMTQAADLEDRCPDDLCSPDIEGEVDTMMALGHVSTVSFVVAGAGAALGLYGLFASGPEPEPGTARVIQPVLSPGFTGVMGTF